MDQEYALGVIPIIRIRGLLLVSIQAPPSDSQAKRLTEDLLVTVSKTGSKKLVIDVSALDLIDSYLTRVLYDMLDAAKTLGVQGAIVGIRPAVAITLVQMGLDSFKVPTFLDLDTAMRHLQENP